MGSFAQQNPKPPKPALSWPGASPELSPPGCAHPTLPNGGTGHQRAAPVWKNPRPQTRSRDACPPWKPAATRESSTRSTRRPSRDPRDGKARQRNGKKPTNPKVPLLPLSILPYPAPPLPPRTFRAAAGLSSSSSCCSSSSRGEGGREAHPAPAAAAGPSPPPPERRPPLTSPARGGGRGRTHRTPPPRSVGGERGWGRLPHPSRPPSLSLSLSPPPSSSGWGCGRPVGAPSAAPAPRTVSREWWKVECALAFYFI